MQWYITVETDSWSPSISRIYISSKGRSLPKLSKLFSCRLPTTPGYGRCLQGGGQRARLALASSPCAGGKLSGDVRGTDVFLPSATVSRVHRTLRRTHVTAGVA